MLICCFGNGPLRNAVLSEAQSELGAEELACTTDERGRQGITSSNQTTAPETLWGLKPRDASEINVCRGKARKHNKLFSY